MKKLIVVPGVVFLICLGQASGRKKDVPARAPTISNNPSKEGVSAQWADHFRGANQER